ncbi:hypothetical protein F4805DRAFT_476145 [Annulohypoxylon moriforme]|nr:hypothetical protein F4805DRAFT_476145 [Annulohypoxylon moriforme]
MGNILSTLRSCFGCGRASDPHEGDIPLGVMAHHTSSKDNVHNPPVPPTGGDETAFPTGEIQLPAGEGHDSNDSIQSTVVEVTHEHGEENTAPDNASAGGATARPDGDVQQQSEDTSMETGIENAQIQTVRRTSILRVGPPRIVETRPTANDRSVTFKMPDTPPPSPGLQHSATSPELDNDPVANYIKKNAEIIKAAKKKLDKVDFSLHRKAEHAQYRKNLKKKPANDLYMVPYYDEGEIHANDAGMVGMGIPTYARVPSKAYAQQIRDLCGQSLRPASIHQPRQVKSMNHLRGDKNMSLGSPGSPGGTNSRLLTPKGAFPRRGVSDPLSPLAGPPEMAHQSDINARRGLARFKEMSPGKRLSVVEEGHPQETTEAQEPLLDTEGKPAENPSEGEQKQVEEQTEEHIEVQVGEKLEEKLEKEAEDKTDKKTSDLELWNKALDQVDQTLLSARAPILNKVRKHIEDEVHAAYITEAILGMADDIVEECAHADNADSQHMVRTQVTKIRRISDMEMKIERISDADIAWCAEATKNRKAAVLVEKWKAEAKAEEESKMKGKGKAVEAVDVAEEKKDEGSGDGEDPAA